MTCKETRERRHWITPSSFTEADGVPAGAVKESTCYWLEDQRGLKLTSGNSWGSNGRILSREPKQSLRGNSPFTWCWENWCHTCQRVSLEPHLTPYAEINWKWARDLSLGAKTVNILKILEEKSSWYWIWNDFVDMTPKSTDSNKQVDELDFIKIKNFCVLKGTNRKLKTQPTQQERTSANQTPEQG